jgi:hypothetical protein
VLRTRAGDPADVVDPARENSGAVQPREARARLACAARARVSATRLNTFFRPAATMPSPEKTPDRIDGARRGGGSDPARRLRPSWLAASPADGYIKILLQYTKTNLW